MSVSGTTLETLGLRRGTVFNCLVSGVLRWRVRTEMIAVVGRESCFDGAVTAIY